MSRPFTKRETKRAAINAETVRKWFGKNSAAVTDRTVRTIIAAADAYSSLGEREGTKEYLALRSARGDFQKAVAAADAAKTAIQNMVGSLGGIGLFCEDGYKEELEKCFDSASKLEVSLLRFNFKGPLEYTWPICAEQSIGLIAAAVSEVGGDPLIITPKSLTVHALGRFLAAIGFSVSPLAITRWIISEFPPDEAPPP